MNFVLGYRHGPELVEIDDIPQVIDRADQITDRKKRWTFVNNPKRATVFTKESLAEIARDKHCRLSWIIVKPQPTNDRTECKPSDETVCSDSR